jgi:hypothetical protein
MKLDKDKFLSLLEHLDRGEWRAYLDHWDIQLLRNNDEMIFSPVTAVYFTLSGVRIHRGSFWFEEMCDYGLPWWEIHEIVYASQRLDFGRKYDRVLRNRILEAVGLPKEKIIIY